MQKAPSRAGAASRPGGLVYRSRGYTRWHDSSALPPVYVRPVIAAVCVLLLGGCTGGDGAIRVVRNRDAHNGMIVRETRFIGHPVPARFTVCHGNTCAQITEVHLSPAQWARVRRVFEPPPPTAAAEREAIRRAVALLETMVGVQAGTSGDLGMNVPGFGLPGQMDCIDEATDTTVYLRMMQDDGLLHFHTVADRATRGWFRLGFGPPHSTAVIREKATGTLYAVDSWFLDNGQPPFVVPLRVWKAGWEPPPPRK